jgi:hypothetical protein
MIPIPIQIKHKQCKRLLNGSNMVKWIPQRFINIIKLMPEEVGTRAAQPLDAVCEG